MQPINVVFKGIRRSIALEEWARTWAAKLARIHEQILGLDVTIAVPHRHHRRGRLFEIHTDVHVPGADLAGTASHEDPYVAIRDAFRATRRQLEDQARTSQHRTA